MDLVKGDGDFLVTIPGHHDDLLIFQVPRAQFNPDTGTAEFPLIELVARPLVRVVDDGPDALLLEFLVQLLDSLHDGGVLVPGANGDEDQLVGGQLGGKDQALVIGVDHDQGPDEPDGAPQIEWFKRLIPAECRQNTDIISFIKNRNYAGVI